jgi:hypothetical protein
MSKPVVQEAAEGGQHLVWRILRQQMTAGHSSARHIRRPPGPRVEGRDMPPFLFSLTPKHEHRTGKRSARCKVVRVVFEILRPGDL